VIKILAGTYYNRLSAISQTMLYYTTQSGNCRSPYLVFKRVNKKMS